MEIFEIFIIGVPYFLLWGIATYSVEIWRTPREMRPLAMNSEVLSFSLGLHVPLAIISSILIALIENFLFLILLFATSAFFSGLTGNFGKKIYYLLVADPLLKESGKEKLSKKTRVWSWGRLLFLPVLFSIWIVLLVVFYL